MTHLGPYRARETEHLRTNDLLALMSVCGIAALDVGARDGRISRLMGERFDHVAALEPSQPGISRFNYTRKHVVLYIAVPRPGKPTRTFGHE